MEGTILSVFRHFRLNEAQIHIRLIQGWPKGEIFRKSPPELENLENPLGLALTFSQKNPALSP